MSITCGNCKSKHDSIEEVRTCYRVASLPAATAQPEHLSQSIPPTSVDTVRTNEATEKQISFIDALVQQRMIAGCPDIVKQAAHELQTGGISRKRASQLIEELKAIPATVAAPDTSVGRMIPSGHYVVTIDDVDKFYRVNKPTEGKWKGYTFVDAQASDEYYPIKNKATKEAILAAIEQQGVMDCLKRYGFALGKCGICNRTLTDPESIAAGIGPICAGRL